MSAKPVHNVYALLGISPLADAATISQAISRHRQQQSLNPAILDKAQTWLLNSDIRQRYDAQLKQQTPELFAIQATSLTEPSTLSLQADTTPPRMGLLDETIHDGRGGVHIEPDIQFDTDVYSHSYQRYNLLSKLVIYGSITALVLSMVFVFSWPLLQRTVFAPSEWDKVEFRQQLVQKGWQEEVGAQYVYLEAQEYDTRLALVYENHQIWPVLIDTLCDMNPQGLCQVHMTVNTHSDHTYVFDDTVGMGLRGDMPLSTRQERAKAIQALKDAQNIEVQLQSGDENIVLTFTP